MIVEIKKIIPLWLKYILRPIYYRLRCIANPHGSQTNVLRGRNWNIDISVPLADRKAFLQSALMGTIDLPIRTSHTNVLLCAQPKSASLYMVKLLSLSLGFRNHQIGFNKAGGAIYYPRLLASKYTGENTISHCHAEATPQVLTMITMLNLRPIILTRSLLDALVSRRDMLLRDKWAGNILSQQAIDSFVTGSHEYQMDVIIDLFADQYMNFFVGWQQYRHDTKLKPVYMSYQELIDDEVGLVQRVAAELDVSVSREAIQDVSSRIAKAGGINFSTGATGRGRDAFTNRQIRLLRKKASILGCHDEGFLGFEMCQQEDPLDEG
jgi:hypothetical protein